MVRKSLLVALITAFVLVGGAVPAATPPTVLATLGGFAPPAVSVSRGGDMLTFTSLDVFHSLTTNAALCVDNSTVPPGRKACDVQAGMLQSRTVSFASGIPTGVYEFRCVFHPWMIGAIAVN